MSTAPALTPVELVWWLLVSHAIMDFWAQSDALAQMKNRHHSRGFMWQYALTSHAMMHGAGVALVTGSVALGVAETAAHWLIDFGKCENWYGIHVDQALHVACKVVWAGVVLL